MKILYPGAYLVVPMFSIDEERPSPCAIVVFHLNKSDGKKQELWWTYNGSSQAQKLDAEQQFREILGKIDD